MTSEEMLQAWEEDHAKTMAAWRKSHDKTIAAWKRTTRESSVFFGILMSLYLMLIAAIGSGMTVLSPTLVQRAVYPALLQMCVEITP